MHTVIFTTTTTFFYKTQRLLLLLLRLLQLPLQETDRFKDRHFKGSRAFASTTNSFASFAKRGAALGGIYVRE
jgi:hypothetical protein